MPQLASSRHAPQGQDKGPKLPHSLLLRLKVDASCPSIIVVALEGVHRLAENSLDLPGYVSLLIADPVFGGWRVLPFFEDRLDRRPVLVPLTAEIKVFKAGKYQADDIIVEVGGSISTLHYWRQERRKRE